MRGGAVWQLVGLITRRSQVQILPPLPRRTKRSRKRGRFFRYGVSVPCRAGRSARATATATATAAGLWVGRAGWVGGGRQKPPLAGSGPAAGGWAFGRLRSNASQAKAPSPCGPRFALARVRCPAHAARPGLGSCPTRQAHAPDPWRSTPPPTHPAPPSTGPRRFRVAGLCPAIGGGMGKRGGGKEGYGIPSATRKESHTAFLFFLARLAATGNCPGPGGWVVGDCWSPWMGENKPTWTYLRRVPHNPPARTSPNKAPSHQPRGGLTRSTIARFCATHLDACNNSATAA